MASIKQDIKENFRKSFEEHGGIVGQVLKDRREKQEHEKQVTAELAQINVKSTRLKNDGRAFKKIEVSSIQISENLQLINKWADVQVTTHEETHQALKEQQQEAAQQEKLPKISIPNPKEDESTFNSILDLFDKMGKKIKVRFPKGLKKGVKTGLNFAKKILKSPITRVAGTVAIGVAAATYSKGLNQNEDKELEERRKLPPTITTPPKQEEPVAIGNEGRRTASVAAPPPAPSAPPQKQEEPVALNMGGKRSATPAIIQAPPPPLPAPPPAPAAIGNEGRRTATPPPAPTPVAAPKAAATEPKKTLDVTKVAPSVKPPDVAASYASGKQETTSSSVPTLPSVVTVKSDASIDGVNSELAKRVATMAVAFEKETGQKLKINSGIRTNEEQKILYDAKVAELKGDEKKARGVVAEPMAPLGKGKGSLHFKELGGLALDIEPNGSIGLNRLAGTQRQPTGWLEKFGLIRPVQKYNDLKQRWEEDWHVQLANTPPIGDNGAVAGKNGSAVDLGSGKNLPIPTDPNTGAKLVDSSKTVAQLKQEQSQRGVQTVVVTDTTNKTEYTKKKQPQGQTAAAVG